MIRALSVLRTSFFKKLEGFGRRKVGVYEDGYGFLLFAGVGHGDV